MILSLVIIVASLIISGYFLIKTPLRLFAYWLFMLLNFLMVIGGVIKILHLTGADELMLIASFSNLIAGVLLIYVGIKTYDHRFLRMLLGFLLITQLALTLPFIEYGVLVDVSTQFFIYPIFLLSVLIIMRKVIIHEGERNMLWIILIYSILGMIAQISMYLNLFDNK